MDTSTQSVNPESTAVQADAILSALAEMDLAATVEQSGGGTATIYAGRDVSAIAIGPGSYDWENPSASTFDYSELFVGPDDDSGHGYYVESIKDLKIAVLAVQGDARSIDYLSKECAACAGSGIVPRRGTSVAVACPTCEGRGVVRW